MKNESWIHTYWRPAIAWSYLIICVFDFLIGPIFFAVYQGIVYPNQPFVAWKPNTLTEGGLYHIAMMTIVGVSAWTRGQEKIVKLGMFAPVEEPKPEPPSYSNTIFTQFES